MIRCYNWNIANDTFVPLPDSRSEAVWRIGLLDWLEWFRDDNHCYFPMGQSGHC